MKLLNFNNIFKHIHISNTHEMRFAIILMTFFISLCFSGNAYAQTSKQIRSSVKKIKSIETDKRGYLVGYRIENKDTVYVDKLRPAYVFNRPQNWKKSKAWRDYYKTVYNFKKVYPYALLAKEIVHEADSVLSNSNFTSRQHDKYIKKYERRLFSEFEKPLRGLSYSQGRLLLRLIDREIGQTSFYIIKGYKGGFTAVFWQGIAKIFGSDLKKPYDKFGEDKIVEELVQLYQEGSFDYLYYSMFTK